MNSKSFKHFSVDWVLKNELALGPAPRKKSDFNLLHQKGIVAILSLCGKDEVFYKDDISLEFVENKFTCRRVILPDHRVNTPLNLEQLNHALNVLSEIILLGPVFAHCVAAIERSPLVCMAWLIRKHNLKPQQALDYIMQVHPGSCPLSSQLKLLREL